MSSIAVDLAKLAPFIMIGLGLIALWSFLYYRRKDKALGEKWVTNTIFLMFGIIAWIPCWISYYVIFFEGINPNDLSVYVLLSILGWVFVARFIRDWSGAFLLGLGLFILISAMVIALTVLYGVVNVENLTVKFEGIPSIPIIILILIIVFIPIIVGVLWYVFVEAPLDLVLTIFLLFEGLIGLLNIIQGIALIIWEDGGLLHFL